MNNLRQYDEGLKRLEEIVEQLDNKELSLEDNIKLYEEGVKLHKKLKHILDTERGNIKLIKEDKEVDVELNFLEE